VVKARTWFTLFIVSLGTLAATVSCGSDEATGGSGGASGGGIISAGGRAGAVGRAGSGNADSAIGTSCTSDAQCGAGLKCATVANELFGANSGPAHGMCTMPCDPNLRSADCAAVEPGSGCVDFGSAAAPAGYCLESCVPGGNATDAVSKCSGRFDVACVNLGSVAQPAPFCLPQCISDADCGTGLFCDKGIGLCTSVKPAGDPTGTVCDPNAATTTCQSFCLPDDDAGTTGRCAEYCSVGVPCMFTGTTPGGFCVGSGTGDLGFCEPLCSCTSDCPFGGDLCRKWASGESDLANALGSDGLCYPTLLQSVELTTCGEGGAGGAGGSSGSAGAAGDGAGGTAGESAAAGASGSGI